MPPRLVAVTGFKDSGKTRLVELLTRELIERGHQVGVIKHTDQSHETDTPGKDTWRYRKAGAYASVFVTPVESAYFFSSSPTLVEVIGRLGDADLILLEGFKKLDTVPKILIARNPHDVEKLSSGLEIAVVGCDERTTGRGAPNREMQVEEVKSLASLVEEEAMPLLPGLNCGRCGYGSCKELAIAAVKGHAETTRCLNLVTEGVQLTVDGKVVNINTFVGQVLRNVILAIVSTLKGVEAPTLVEVKLSSTGEEGEGAKA